VASLEGFEMRADAAAIMRYEMRRLSNGWAVWDTKLNAPAAVKGCWQTALPVEDVDDLTDLLNWRDSELQASSAH
jgi:hypothetical protein